MTKHQGLGPLFDDSMAIRYRKGARHCGGKQSNVLKTDGFWTTFDVSDVVLFTDRRTQKKLVKLVRPVSQLLSELISYSLS